jgi:hypothetical protein
MIGWFGTLRLKSLLTLIFSPVEGTLMCWYMTSPRDVRCVLARGATRRSLIRASARHLRAVNVPRATAVTRATPRRRFLGGGPPSKSHERKFMSKLLAALVSIAFAGAVLAQTQPAPTQPAPAADAPKAEAQSPAAGKATAKATAKKSAKKRTTKAKPKAAAKTEDKKS